MSSAQPHGVFVGRMCPPHLGHEQIVRTMLRECPGNGNSLIILGSANTPMSLRHFFSYSERRSFVERLFPHVNIVGLPDFFNNNQEWYTALDDLLKLAGFTPEEVTFFGGCEEDLRFFIERGRKVYEVNRFDGSTPKISATEVRDALIHDRSLEGLLNPVIHEAVKANFKVNWEKFRKM